MYHIPVMLDECIEGLNIQSDSIIVDVTFGGGGHSRAILDQLGPNGKLYAFDRDSDAKSNLIADSRLTFIPQNFQYYSKFLKLYGVEKVDGILADLGISSWQIDQPERGFSTRSNAELDMRMDSNADLSAADIINGYNESDLADVIYYYGEINNARKLASIICAKRKEEKIKSTFDLINVIEPWIKGNRNQYLAKLFQALRIEVNGELEALKELLIQSETLLNPGGRLVVMSYHSLEDRLVKNWIRSGNVEGKIEKDLFGNFHQPFKAINKKIITASEEELKENPRSRSAKLRIAEKK